MGQKVKGEKWNTFEKSGANNQNTREGKKKLPQLTSKQQLYTTIKN